MAIPENLTGGVRPWVETIVVAPGVTAIKVGTFEALIENGKGPVTLDGQRLSCREFIVRYRVGQPPTVELVILPRKKGPAADEPVAARPAVSPLSD